MSLYRDSSLVRRIASGETYFRPGSFANEGDWSLVVDERRGVEDGVVLLAATFPLASF